MISIVTPVFNGETHLERTLESLSRQSVPFEHLVMDGGSTDNTCQVVEKHRSRHNTRVLTGPDKGLYDAIQKGFRLVKGDVLGWLNAGDLYMPWTLSVVERIFQEHPDVEWLTGVPSLFREETNTLAIGLYAPVYHRSAIGRGWHNGRWLDLIQQESTFWRRSLWERSGAAELFLGQGRGKGYAMDFHLWKLFARHARLHTVGSLLAAFCISPGQISEVHRERYFQECGLRHPPVRSNRWLMILFRVYSVLNARKCLTLESRCPPDGQPLL